MGSQVPNNSDFRDSLGSTGLPDDPVTAAKERIVARLRGCSVLLSSTVLSSSIMDFHFPRPGSKGGKEEVEELLVFLSHLAYFHFVLVICSGTRTRKRSS
ncbi:hypothetical protein ACH5RR_000940 [Cinchona calisaya]|uniref:Uncharacterized protein n=1 Tax=Cinchona calisaya TaxID=153742 RepID=A0ABD3B357_9GENT